MYAIGLTRNDIETTSDVNCIEERQDTITSSQEFVLENQLVDWQRDKNYVCALTRTLVDH